MSSLGHSRCCVKDSLVGLADVNIDRDVFTMGCTSTAPRAQEHSEYQRVGAKGDWFPGLIQLSYSFQLSRLCLPWQRPLLGITCASLSQHHCQGPSPHR